MEGLKTSDDDPKVVFFIHLSDTLRVLIFVVLPERLHSYCNAKWTAFSMSFAQVRQLVSNYELANISKTNEYGRKAQFKVKCKTAPKI